MSPVMLYREELMKFLEAIMCILLQERCMLRAHRPHSKKTLKLMFGVAMQGRRKLFSTQGESLLEEKAADTTENLKNFLLSCMATPKVNLTYSLSFSYQLYIYSYIWDYSNTSDITTSASSVWFYRTFSKARTF